MAEALNMFAASRQLAAVQDIDLDIARVVASLGELPAECRAIAAAMEAARVSIASLKQRLEEEELAERRLEGEMREREALLERLDAQTAQVVSAQAYKALLTEIDNATSARSELETRALELMEAIDSLQTELASERERLEQLEATAPERLAEIDKRGAQLEADRERWLAQRQQACEGIPREVVSRYDLIAAKRQPATAILSGSSCPTCQMAVPAQRAREVHLGQLIYTCASCRRMLLAEEAFEGTAQEI